MSLNENDAMVTETRVHSIWRCLKVIFYFFFLNRLNKASTTNWAHHFGEIQNLIHNNLHSREATRHKNDCV